MHLLLAAVVDRGDEEDRSRRQRREDGLWLNRRHPSTLKSITGREPWPTMPTPGHMVRTPKRQPA
jgi:hypothetical protein